MTRDYRGERTILWNDDGTARYVNLLFVGGAPFPLPDGADVDWGWSGSAPLELARLILLHCTADPVVAEMQAKAFRNQFIAGWGPVWEISESTIREWLGLGQTVCEEVMPTHELGGEG